MVNYNFYQRSHGRDEILFGKGKVEPLPQSPFSLPPKSKNNELDEFTIIERPSIPELDGFIEKYLDEPSNKSNNVKKLVKEK